MFGPARLPAIRPGRREPIVRIPSGNPGVVILPGTFRAAGNAEHLTVDLDAHSLTHDQRLERKTTFPPPARSHSFPKFPCTPDGDPCPCARQRGNPARRRPDPRPLPRPALPAGIQGCLSRAETAPSASRTTRERLGLALKWSRLVCDSPDPAGLFDVRCPRLPASAGPAGFGEPCLVRPAHFPAALPPPAPLMPVLPMPAPPMPARSASPRATHPRAARDARGGRRRRGPRAGPLRRRAHRHGTLSGVPK
jgi:hypothetical protein